MSETSASSSATESADTTEKSPYEVTSSDVGPARKRVTITVPPNVIDEKIAESMGALATETALPGFRKGRAPKALLERRFGDAVRTETKNQIVADGYASALEQCEIRPVGEPEPVETIDDLKIEAGQSLTFSVEVEVLPEFDLPELESIEIKKPVLDVEDEHVSRELERQCLMFGESAEVKSDFTEGDRLIGPGTVNIVGEDEPFFSHNDVDIVVPGSADGGRGTVLGLLIDGLAKTLKGTSVGETVTLSTTGPEVHEREEIRGKKITIEVMIREARRITPATVEEVVERTGLGSEELVREQIKLALERRRDEEQRTAMREQVNRHLLDAVDFELPEKLSAAQASRMLERQRLELIYRGGMTTDEVEIRLAEIRSETEEQSRRRLKLTFLLHRLAEHFEVEVTDQEVNGRVAAMAAERGVRPEALRAELTQTGSIGQITGQLREHKAADRVIDQARVTEVPADEYLESMRDPDAAAGGTKKKTTRKTSAKKKTTTSKKTSKRKTGRAAGSEQ